MINYVRMYGLDNFKLRQLQHMSHIRNALPPPSHHQALLTDRLMLFVSHVAWTDDHFWEMTELNEV